MSDIGTNPDQSIRYDSSATEASGDNERHSIQTYVSDMLALERHIAQPLKRQLDMTDTTKYGGALSVIATMKSLADSHVTALEQCLKQLGGHEASPVKSAWSELLGFGAAAVDSVRKTKVSKNLRDDYTALNLAAISYTLLHATSVGLGDTMVADLANRHLADYARIIMQITQTIPDVVLQELRDDGETVVTGAAELIRRQTNEIWKAQADVTD
jgi:ferritin-like metal-binding protein YciE